MTLTEIQNKIIEQLNKLTVDDFYAEPINNIAKDTFCKLTSISSDKEIEKYLFEKFNEISQKLRDLMVNLFFTVFSLLAHSRVCLSIKSLAQFSISSFCSTTNSCPLAADWKYPSFLHESGV